MKGENGSAQHHLFFTMQPLLDSRRSIWGYELLGGEMREGIHEVFPQRESAAGLSSSAYWGLQEAMERGKRIMIGLDAESILKGVPYAMLPSSGRTHTIPGTGGLAFC